MDPRLTLAAALVAAAPFPALAQTWTAAVVSSAPKLAVQARWLAIPNDTTLPAATTAGEWRPVRLDLRPPIPPRPAPDVRIPAKPEWTDDQGVRFSFNRVSYKERF